MEEEITVSGAVLKQDVMIPMRDGVRLAADIYFPAPPAGRAEQERFPALLIRTSWDKSNEEWDPVRTYYPQRGYALVIQDLRSRFKSEGDGRYYHTANPWEGEDGYDTVEWVAAQPWCNGRIGTLGSSHRGIVQTVMALHRPPHLGAQWVEQAPTNIYAHEAREGGAMALHMAAAIHNHALDAQELRNNQEGVRRVIEIFRNMGEWLGSTPWQRGETGLADAPCLEDTLFNYYQRGEYDEWWGNENNDQEPYLDRHADVPAAISGGWWDPFADASTNLFAQLKRRNASPTRLVMGPWSHGGMRSDATHEGDADFGKDAPWGMAEFNRVRGRWYDRWLKGEENGVEREPPVLIFVMGGGGGARNADGRLHHGGVWRAEQEWPIARTRKWRLYMHRDGSLKEEAPDSDSPPLTYLFDPERPVPTLGGNMASFSSLPRPEDGGPVLHEIPPFGQRAAAVLPHVVSLVPTGPMHQRERPGLIACSPPYPLLADRPDVLVFETPTLEEDVEITGPAKVRLWVASSTPDTDFTAKLLDVYPPSNDYPEGYHMNVVDSVLRCRYRESWTQPVMMAPGQVYPITIPLPATSNLFKAGHRIRVDVSSSNFPRLDVNPNTGEPMGRHTRLQTAENAVFVDRSRPSHVTLPVIPAQGSRT